MSIKKVLQERKANLEIDRLLSYKNELKRIVERMEDNDHLHVLHEHIYSIIGEIENEVILILDNGIVTKK